MLGEREPGGRRRRGLDQDRRADPARQTHRPRRAGRSHIGEGRVHGELYPLPSAPNPLTHGLLRAKGTAVDAPLSRDEAIPRNIQRIKRTAGGVGGHERVGHFRLHESPPRLAGVPHCRDWSRYQSEVKCVT